MGSQTQNFHRDQFRISESKQDKSHIDCVAFERREKKKATEFFLTGGKSCIRPTSARQEAAPFWGPDGFGSPLGEEGGVHLRVVQAGARRK